MMILGMEALMADDNTEVIVLVSKPPPMALRTGGNASNPIPAEVPAATTTS